MCDRSQEQPVPGQHGDPVLLLACGHGPATTAACISVGVWTWAVGCPPYVMRHGALACRNVMVGMGPWPAEMLCALKTEV